MHKARYRFSQLTLGHILECYSQYTMHYCVNDLDLRFFYGLTYLPVTSYGYWVLQVVTSSPFIPPKVRSAFIYHSYGLINPPLKIFSMGNSKISKTVSSVTLLSSLMQVSLTPIFNFFLLKFSLALPAWNITNRLFPLPQQQSATNV